MPYKKSPMKKSSCIKMYDKKGKPSGLMMEGSAMHMESAGSPAKQIDEREGEKFDGNLGEVVVTGDASKVGAYGRQLDKAFEKIQNTLDTTGYGHGTGQQEAGLGYTKDPRAQLKRLQEMREKEGAAHTLKYMRRRSRDTVGGSGIPDFLSMPPEIKG